ncbi:hypothetical protein EVAR_61228_1 [Eumeta japonica]|uniref:Uncharacterized protein n=1 Tax=Eumeta variegata TaxID=151549 RepID=A0A4C1Z941_EUMVA|nr:hypothetical protein EVAR_61228_1 [Eumeta japonica]
MLSGPGGEAKKVLTHALIKDIVTKALQNMGYECPENDLDRFVPSATPASSRASSSTTTPASSQSSSSQTSRSHSPSKGNKRRASSRSEDETSNSGSTVVGSDNKSDSNNSTKPDKVTKADTSFTLVRGKTKRAIQEALKKSKLSSSPPTIGWM